VLYRVAALMVGAAEAEEIVQDAFERGMRQRDFFATVREPRAWLRTVAARRAVDRLRRRRILERLRPATPPGPNAWERLDLALALRRLGARPRVAIVLRYYQDASYDEIATALGVAPSSVGPLLTRARAELREALC